MSYTWANEKLAINLYASGRYNYSSNEGWNKTTYRKDHNAIPDSTYDTTASEGYNNNSENNRLNGNIFAHVSYEIDSMTNIEFMGNYNYSHSKGESYLNRYRNDFINNKMFQYFDTNLSNNNSGFGMAGIDFTHKFDKKGHNIRASIHENFSNGNSRNDFIRQYTSRNSRWGSPKYVAGESYGTTRAVGICQYLNDTYAMNLNGLILISSVNDFAGVDFIDGNDLPYALFIPTYAADAWYHGLLSREYQEMKLEEYLKEVRRYVEDEYVPALFQGSRYTKEELDALAGTYAGYTGLEKEYVLSANLRVGLEDFLTQLLKDKKLVTGRLDGRITGPYTGGSIDNGDSDPSATMFDLSFGNAFNEYVSTELGFQTDRPYLPANDGINSAWTFPIDSWGGYLSQEKILHDCVSKNPFLKIWVLCGYYDGATPFYSAEYTFNHVFLNEELKDHVTFTYYPCGHMIYMEKDSFDTFRKDAKAWFGSGNSMGTDQDNREK